MSDGSEVLGIVIHDGWSPDDDSNYAHDIALLKLKNEINFTRLVFPICLENNSQILNIKIV